MQDEPDLPRDVIVSTLRDCWGIEAVEIDYAPLGFGSYHWHATDASGQSWFVTADDLSNSGVSDEAAEGVFGDLVAAHESARRLHDAGLEFVLAPTPDKGGNVVARVLPCWSLVVHPRVEGSVSPSGDWQASPPHGQAAELVARLHAASPPSSLRRWDGKIPRRSSLLEALTAPASTWNTGPYGDATRALLSRSRNAIERLIEHYDALAAPALHESIDWVVTHGEPHAQNFIAYHDGCLYLIDWDTARLAPRERDLSVLLDGDENVLDAYREVVGPVTPRPEIMELFDLRWRLADICVYVHRFRQPHAGTEDDRKSWEGLRSYLE